MRNRIDDRIEYINWSEEPLSADVIIIRGDKNTWIFDIGESEEALNEIKSIDGPKCIVLSHFHGDHIGNIRRIREVAKKAQESGVKEDLKTKKEYEVKSEDFIYPDDMTFYVSKHTYKYIGAGNIITEEVTLHDGVTIKLIPMPSPHAKGCIALEVDEKYLFLGDAIYPTYKDGHGVYNTQLLKSQIDILESVKAEKFYLSHDKKPFVLKKVIVAFLKKIYEKRKPGETSIVV